MLGIIRSFRDIASSNEGGFSVVAQGVSEALWATGGGILVAVIAVAVYNYFQTRGNRVTVEVKLVLDEFLELLNAVTSGQIATGNGNGGSMASVEAPAPMTPVNPAPAEG